jgi:hypothetical protein
LSLNALRILDRSKLLNADVFRTALMQRLLPEPQRKSKFKHGIPPPAGSGDLHISSPCLFINWHRPRLAQNHLNDTISHSRIPI